MQLNTLNLSGTDLNVSNLCFGTADFGAGVSEELSYRLLDQYIASGGNFLDTAAIYAAWTPAGKGSSERLLGHWLRQNQPANLVLATKGGHPELASIETPRMTRTDVEGDLNQSLSNLGVETIDLYYLHRDDPSLPVEEVLDCLESFVHAGKIRYYALSNWKLERAEAARLAAQKCGAKGFVATQLLWSLAEANLAGGDPTLATMTPEYKTWHQQNDVPAIPYTSQANGYFNKLAQGLTLPGNVEHTYNHEINQQRWKIVQQIQAETGLSVTQIVLGYLLSQPFTVVPIIGCKNEAQLQDSLAATDVKLSAQHVEALENPA